MKKNKNKKQIIGSNKGEIYQFEDDDNKSYDLKPELYWPFYDYFDNKILVTEKDLFPGSEIYINSFIIARKHKDRLEYQDLIIKSSFFIELCNCRKAYILDKHFDVKEFKRILQFLQEAEEFSVKQIFIICGSSYNDLKIEKENCDKLDELHVDIKISSVDNMKALSMIAHDRFALLDNEIWHFGWTICGIGNDFTAYSRGWIDKNNYFRDFLDKIVSG